MREPSRPLSFLFATWEGGGSVAPALTVAAKLARRGCRVRVMSDACNRPEAEAAGAAFRAWTRAPSRPDRSRESDVQRDWDVAAPPEGLLRLFEHVVAGPARGYAEDVAEELAREPADLVVSSELLPGAAAGAEAAGVPHVLLAVNLCPFPIEGVPPFGPGFAPARTAAERALHAEVAAGTAALFETGLPALNAARAAVGLAPLASMFDYPKRAAALLVATARAFDFAPESLPPHVRYVGPQLDAPSWAASWTSPWPADDPRPLVLVAFSTSFQNHVGALQRVVDACSTLPVRALVTLGDTVRPDELTAPENVALVHSAPHDAVMREAAAVVTHGGHGTVMRALAHRRPMLLMPHGRDQADNTVRVTERDAGLSLSPDAPAEAIAAALRRLLTEPAFAGAAAALGERVAAEAVGSPVVAELERLAAPAPAVAA